MSEPSDNDINVRLIEKINQVEEKYVKNFSNTQKILMTTDGSITAILDVLYGKIALKTLEQHFEEWLFRLDFYNNKTIQPELYLSH